MKPNAESRIAQLTRNDEKCTRALMVEGWTGPSALQSVRDLGDDAAHEAASLEPADLLAALDAVEHLLKSVFGNAQQQLIARNSP